MDADRFDAWTRSLVGPRRAALRALAGAALGALLAAPTRLVGAAGDPRLGATERAAAARRRRPGPTCHVEEHANGISTTLTVKLKQQKLTLTTVNRAPLDPEEEQTNTTTIRRGRRLLLRFTQTIEHSGRATVRTTYGAGFAGVEEIFFVVEGGTISGAVDGRAIAPFAVGAVPETLQFQDGQPAPEMAVSERVAAQIAQILARAQAKQPDCAPAQGRPARGAGRRVGAAGDDLGAACLLCGVLCTEAKIICDFAVLGRCVGLVAVPFVGPGLYAGCLASGWAGCWQARFECWDACGEPGAPCCERPCGDVCCLRGEQCLADNQCCAGGTSPCQGVCCPDGRCLPGGCCNSPDSVCGQTCCPSSSTCCNGVCCNRECCNGVCCRRGEACDPLTGACVVRCNPDFAERRCPDEPVYPACCPELFTCCPNGECCGPNLECCPNGGRFRCLENCNPA